MKSDRSNLPSAILWNSFSQNSPYSWCFLLVIFHPLPPSPLLGCKYSLAYAIFRDELNISPPLHDPIEVVPISIKMCCCLVAKSCPTLCNPMDCSLPGPSVHGIPQARILEWVAISFFSASSQPKDWIYVSCIGRRILYCWATQPPTYLLKYSPLE